MSRWLVFVALLVPAVASAANLSKIDVLADNAAQGGVETHAFDMRESNAVRLTAAAGEGLTAPTQPVGSAPGAGVEQASPSLAPRPRVKPHAQRDLVIIRTVVIGLTLLASAVVVFQGRRA